MNNGFDLLAWLRSGEQLSSEQLGLPDGFLQRLQDEDDWSFLVKAGALTEAMLTDQLAKRFNDEAIEDVIADLPQFQRIKWCLKLNIITKEQGHFLRQLSSLRNYAAHDVTSVNMDLAQYVTQMPDNKQKPLLDSLRYLISGIVSPDDVTEMVLGSPKDILYYGVKTIIDDLYRPPPPQRSQKDTTSESPTESN